MILVSKTSELTGITHRIWLPISKQKLDQWVTDSRGILIQDFFPELTPGQREFLITGATEQEWEDAFPEEEE